VAGTGDQVDFDRVQRSSQQSAASLAAPDRVLLFAGHMIDKPSRAAPRFPAAQEATARRAIRAAIAQVRCSRHWPAVPTS
jgi:hypothetical protein